MVAPSCLNLPIAVCLTGVEYWSWASSSTTHPKRFTSFGSSTTEKRGSIRSQPRPSESMPYRASLPSGSTAPVASKYWLKFSSPDSTVPHGVSPPAQLLRVPSTRVPVESAVVRSASCPAAGPSRTSSVWVCTRRLCTPSRRYSHGLPNPARWISTTVIPCAAMMMRSCSSIRSSAEEMSGNISSSLVYSLLNTSRLALAEWWSPVLTRLT